MVRCKIPGGKVTRRPVSRPRPARRASTPTAPCASPRGRAFQFHGVMKTNLKETIAGINQCLLTTLGACGDVERNVMAPPAPFAIAAVRRDCRSWPTASPQHLAPRTGAYHEIWLNGEAGPHRTRLRAETEPIYGKVYLPRKFKTGFALPARQFRRRLRPGPRLPGHRRERRRSSATTCSSAAAWA